MMFTNTFFTDNYSRRPEKTGAISVFHRIACVFGVLLTLYCLFYCWCSFTGALQDMRKYGGLGFSHSFWYYLEKNTFIQDVKPFLCVMIELLLYIVQYHMAERKKPFWGSICYFSIILIIHTILCLHANSLSLPEGPPFNPSDFPLVEYRRFANTTTFPSVIYFIVYSLRMWEYRAKGNA